MAKVSTPLMGVDVGQKRDPTAICVGELELREEARPEWHYVIRHLERLQLGTPYPEVVRRVEKVASGVRKKTDISPELYVDATGVGTPIVDLLREGAPAVNDVIAVYFTHGDRRKESEVDGYKQVSLGKAWLVSRLQAFLQTGRIHLPKTTEARALAQELLDFEIKVDENANDKYGAFKVGTHDDLVTALGLVAQVEGEAPQSTYMLFDTSSGKHQQRLRDLRLGDW